MGCVRSRVRTRLWGGQSTHSPPAGPFARGLCQTRATAVRRGYRWVVSRGEGCVGVPWWSLGGDTWRNEGSILGSKVVLLTPPVPRDAFGGGRSGDHDPRRSHRTVGFRRAVVAARCCSFVVRARPPEKMAVSVVDVKSTAPARREYVRCVCLAATSLGDVYRVVRSPSGERGGAGHRPLRACECRGKKGTWPNSEKVRSPGFENRDLTAPRGHKFLTLLKRNSRKETNTFDSA